MDITGMGKLDVFLQELSDLCNKHELIINIKRYGEHIGLYVDTNDVPLTYTDDALGLHVRNAVTGEEDL